MASKEKKGAKFGRNRDRNPSSKRVNQEYRTAKNKRLNEERALQSAMRRKDMRTPRGTARAKRRKHLQQDAA